MSYSPERDRLEATLAIKRTFGYLRQSLFAGVVRARPLLRELRRRRELDRRRRRERQRPRHPRGQDLRRQHLAAALLCRRSRPAAAPQLVRVADPPVGPGHPVVGDRADPDTPGRDPDLGRGARVSRPDPASSVHLPRLGGPAARRHREEAAAVPPGGAALPDPGPRSADAAAADAAGHDVRREAQARAGPCAPVRAAAPQLRGADGRAHVDDVRRARPGCAGGQDRPGSDPEAAREHQRRHVVRGARVPRARQQHRPAGRDVPGQEAEWLLGRSLHAGSTEYVAYWADFGDDCTLHLPRHSQGERRTTTTRSRPAASATRRRCPWTSARSAASCDTPVIGRVRAVLSWGTPPSTTDPDAVPHWGNRLDVRVQLRPGRPYDGTARFTIVGGVPAASVDLGQRDDLARCGHRRERLPVAQRLPVRRRGHVPRSTRPGAGRSALPDPGAQHHQRRPGWRPCPAVLCRQLARGRLVVDARSRRVDAMAELGGQHHRQAWPLHARWQRPVGNPAGGARLRRGRRPACADGQHAQRIDRRR